ncbi:hypothetical protein ARMGADRAFT_1038432 [Armillaria gallica]|uniref:HMG domain-containing protein n=1 Tax=Armillaria gallica TaxID=47427 RepID=A0A2H3CHR7_ARMGA|nr:hypothetical protein ARMGADRAFT_1038432 [Armillaria gallica]
MTMFAKSVLWALLNQMAFLPLIAALSSFHHMTLFCHYQCSARYTVQANPVIYTIFVQGPGAQTLSLHTSRKLCCQYNVYVPGKWQPVRDSDTLLALNVGALSHLGIRFHLLGSSPEFTFTAAESVDHCQYHRCAKCQADKKPYLFGPREATFVMEGVVVTDRPATITNQDRSLPSLSITVCRSCVALSAQKKTNSNKEDSDVRYVKCETLKNINVSLKRQVLEAEMRATLLMDLVQSGMPNLGTPMSVNPSHQLPDVDGINKGIKMMQHHTRGPPQGWHHLHTQAARLQAILLPTLTTTAISEGVNFYVREPVYRVNALVLDQLLSHIMKDTCVKGFPFNMKDFVLQDLHWVRVLSDQSQTEPLDLYFHNIHTQKASVEKLKNPSKQFKYIQKAFPTYFLDMTWEAALQFNMWDAEYNSTPEIQELDDNIPLSSISAAFSTMSVTPLTCNLDQFSVPVEGIQNLPETKDHVEVPMTGIQCSNWFKEIPKLILQGGVVNEEQSEYGLFMIDIEIYSVWASPVGFLHYPQFSFQ